MTVSSTREDAATGEIVPAYADNIFSPTRPKKATCDLKAATKNN
jgi:hypothetical protein